jgi:hypothetical protein
MEDEDPLDNAVILDTAGDIATKFTIRCEGCGDTLQVREIIEEPEVGIIIEIGQCHTCGMREHTSGFFECQDGENLGY